MKKGRFEFILLIVGCICLLCVCGLFTRQKPSANPNELWICDDLPMWFSWDEERKGHYGELVVNESKFNIGIGFRSSVIEVFRIDDEEKLHEKNMIFLGGCKFGKEQFEVSVTRDNANIFGEDLPTITFKRRQVKDKGRQQGDDSSVLTAD